MNKNLVQTELGYKK